MTTKRQRISDVGAIESLITEMQRRPPLSPADLRLRIAAFDLAAVRREMARRLIETKLRAKDEFQLIQWLVELDPKNAASGLLDCLGDASLSASKRALAVIVLTSTHERELHQRAATMPLEQMTEIMLAAQGWLQRMLPRASRTLRPQGASRPAAPRRAGKRSTKSPPRICRLKVTLRDIRPQIWRRIEVSSDVTLARLHRVLQAAFGWTDSHLHSFQVGKTEYGVPDPEWPNETISEKTITLGALVEQGVKRFVYAYDFGDDWKHDILIERTGEPEPGEAYPRCLAGKRACPPEDCGGPWGYEELLQTLSDPKHPDYDHMADWIGELDPEEFDIVAVNRGLRRIR